MSAEERYVITGKSLDELIADYERGIVSIYPERAAAAMSVGLQYRVAKTQQLWTWVSAGVAAASVIVAIAAVLVAAIK